MPTKQITIEDFLVKTLSDEELRQRPNEDFVEWLERATKHPDYYKFFTKETK